jgi:hypothetical protein
MPSLLQGKIFKNKFCVKHFLKSAIKKYLLRRPQVSRHDNGRFVIPACPGTVFKKDSLRVVDPTSGNDIV